MSSLFEIVRNQHGILDRRQATDIVGLSRSQIGRLLTNGELISVHRGVYRHGAVEPNWQSELLAAVLSARGIASHRCAAALWRLDGYSTPPVELTIPNTNWRGLPGLRLHRTTQWHSRDEVLIDQIPTTGINRTILDCAGVVGYRRTEMLAESAIRKGLTSWDDLHETLNIHSRQGRNGCLTLRRLLEYRMGIGAIPLSEFSRLVANLLADAGLPTPQLEYRITDRNGDFVMQADLAWPRRRKAWELDGLEWHFGRTEVERDRRKRNRAKSLGWNIQEILWSMYEDDPAHLVTLARNFLNNS